MSAYADKLFIGSKNGDSDSESSAGEESFDDFLANSKKKKVKKTKTKKTKKPKKIVEKDFVEELEEDEYDEENLTGNFGITPKGRKRKGRKKEDDDIIVRTPDTDGCGRIRKKLRLGDEYNIREGVLGDYKINYWLCINKNVMKGFIVIANGPAIEVTINATKKELILSILPPSENELQEAFGRLATGLSLDMFKHSGDLNLEYYYQSFNLDYMGLEGFKISAIKKDISAKWFVYSVHLLHEDTETEDMIV